MTSSVEPALTVGPVLIIGSGLLGTSLGLALTLREVSVLLDDSSPTALALAVDLGAGRRVEEDDAPNLVVVATPPDVAGEVVAAALAKYPNATVTDVASVKGAVRADLSGADLTRYVGSHPMAGREKSGPIAARTDLFFGRPWIVVPDKESSGTARAAVRALAVDVGASVTTMDATSHDRAVALVSHLPQLVSTLVAAQLQGAPEGTLDLAGQGLRDVTRIASSEPGMWTQILSGNAAEVAAVLTALRGDLDTIIDALSDVGPGTWAALANTFEAGNAGVARIPGKHGGAPQNYDLVSVLVPDTPGSLARLLTLIGEQNFNLEDMLLEHAPRQQMGVATISVLAGLGASLESMLVEHGWRVAS
jgi:prephenate dehydrogenase